jgi:hypothetical protein
MGVTDVITTTGWQTPDDFAERLEWFSTTVMSPTTSTSRR